MRNGRNLRRLLILILLLAPTIFSTGCKSTQITPVEVEAALAAIAPPVPVLPEAETVRFEDRDGGLWLSYSDYRALERNVIALREHIARLEIVIRFYREGK
jgi:hypothetical protein